jgi:hypothetical protein
MFFKALPLSGACLLRLAADEGSCRAQDDWRYHTKKNPKEPVARQETPFVIQLEWRDGSCAIIENDKWKTVHILINVAETQEHCGQQYRHNDKRLDNNFTLRAIYDE